MPDFENTASLKLHSCQFMFCIRKTNDRDSTDDFRFIRTQFCAGRVIPYTYLEIGKVKSHGISSFGAERHGAFVMSTLPLNAGWYRSCPYINSKHTCIVQLANYLLLFWERGIRMKVLRKSLVCSITPNMYENLLLG